MRLELIMVLFIVTVLSACVFVPEPIESEPSVSVSHAVGYDSDYPFVLVEPTGFEANVYARAFDETMDEELTTSPMLFSDENGSAISGFTVIRGDATVPRTIRFCTSKDFRDIPSEGDSCLSSELEGLEGSLSIEGPTSFTYAKSDPVTGATAQRDTIRLVNEGTAIARACVDLPSSRYAGPLDGLIEHEDGSPEWDYGTITKNGAEIGFSPCVVLRPNASATFEVYPLVASDVEPSRYDASAYVRAGFAEGFPQSAESANILERIPLSIDISE